MTIDMHADISDAALGEVTIADDALQVVFHRRYPKPIEKVWAAITTPERLADWLAVAEVQMKPNGTLRMTWNGQFSMEGRVTACEPPRLFAWTWPLDGRETEVRFELQPDEGGCLLTLTHSGLSPRKGSGGGVRAGWHAHLEGLPEAMEGRPTPWATKVAREAALSERYPALPA
jgi:uncharacterized protein YndB with AHSA1/START domain